jgi:hypothetical protein
MEKQDERMEKDQDIMERQDKEVEKRKKMMEKEQDRMERQEKKMEKEEKMIEKEKNKVETEERDAMRVSTGTKNKTSAPAKTRINPRKMTQALQGARLEQPYQPSPRDGFPDLKFLHKPTRSNTKTSELAVNVDTTSIKGVAKTKDEMIILLDIDYLLSKEEFDTLIENKSKE